MLRLKCKNDKDHNFQWSSDELCCSECGISSDEYLNDKRAHEKGVEHYKEIINALNAGNAEDSAEFLSEAMRVSHRTLQADFIRVLTIFLKKYAQQPQDLRNEAAVEWAKAVSKIEVFIPRI